MKAYQLLRLRFLCYIATLWHELSLRPFGALSQWGSGVMIHHKYLWPMNRV